MCAAVFAGEVLTARKFSDNYIYAREDFSGIEFALDHILFFYVCGGVRLNMAALSVRLRANFFFSW